MNKTVEYLWSTNQRFTGIAPTIVLPTNSNTKTSRPRTQWCNGCGFSVAGETSAYLFKKAWDDNHLAYHLANV